MIEFNIQELAIRFIIDFIAIFILVRLIYFERQRNTDFLFILILFNCVNFLICYLLSGAQLEVGFAFGLFAIFSIMRYRTETLPVKEMGYLFLAVALGLINALASKQDGYILLLASNIFVIVLAFILEWTTEKGKNKTKVILYERMELIVPEKKDEMLRDLQTRTGLPVRAFEIVRYDFLKDCVEIKIRY